MSTLTKGSVHISLRKGSNSFLRELNDVIIHNDSGPHPAGNLSTIINKVSPINKGDIVWTLNLPDLAVIGNTILNGKYSPERLIALVGSSITKPKYIKVLSGSSISTFISLNNDNSRIISGNVLTGTKIDSNGHLRHYSNEITAIPEGNDYDLFGWANQCLKSFLFLEHLLFLVISK